MTIDELSELNIRTPEEHPGHARVVVTHLPTGTVIEAVGADRAEAKRLAYEQLAVALTKKGL